MKEEIIKQLKEEAAILTQDGAHSEYVRGICELIASIDGLPEVETPERAMQIAEEIFVHKSVIKQMYYPA